MTTSTNYQPSDPAATDKRLSLQFGRGEALDVREVTELRNAPIHSSAIRTLLLSDTPHSQGHVPQLKVVGATIAGDLDLSFADIDYPIRFEFCEFTDSVILTEAKLRSVSFYNTSARQIDADHVRVTGDLNLDGVYLTDGLSLKGAHLEDDLHLREAVINSTTARLTRAQESGPSEGALLDLNDARIEGAVEAEALMVIGKISTCHTVVSGAFRLTGAVLVSYCSPSSPQPFAWCGDGLESGSDVDASELTAFGQVSLKDAKMKNLVFRNAQIISPGPAVVLHRLACDGSVFCDKEKHAKNGFRSSGRIEAIGARVGAAFYLNGATVRTSTFDPEETDKDEALIKETAVNLRRASIGTDVRCEEGFGTRGIFDVSNATINGNFRLDTAALCAIRPGRDAVVGNGVTVGGALSCQQGLVHGNFNLPNAKIGRAVELNFEHDANFDEKLWRRGLLTDADRNISADLSNMTAEDLTLHGWPDGRLNLARASVRCLQHTWLSNGSSHRRTLFDRWRKRYQERWIRGDRQPTSPPPEPVPGFLAINGFEYVELKPEVEKEKEKGPRPAKRKGSYSCKPRQPTFEELRIAWLERGTTGASEQNSGQQDEFDRQPYRQLAQSYTRAGNDKEARNVLLKMHRANNERMNKRLGRLHIYLWNLVQDVTVGYGYRAWPAILWILLVVGLSFRLFSSAGQTVHGKTVHRSLIEQFILSLGFTLPGTGYGNIENARDLTGNTQHIAAAILIVVGLTLGASIVAALARVLRYRQGDE